MRIRGSSHELVFTFSEFKALDGAELCRRYEWGDWLDPWVNEQAEKELERGLAN